jgi:hypothetical protein
LPPLIAAESEGMLSPTIFGRALSMAEVMCQNNWQQRVRSGQQCSRTLISMRPQYGKAADVDLEQLMSLSC